MATSIGFDIFARDHASKTISHIGDTMNRLGKTAALALGGAAVGGVAALGAAMVQGVKDAADYQTLAAKTAAVLKSTGNVAHQSVAGIQARAAALESMSGVDETVIINGENVLATFTRIRDGVGKGNDIFNQATTASLNLSTALGTDLQGANILVGKALNDPIRGITALTRVGVTFTQKQRDQIKAMMDSGNIMGAQKVILGELGTEFGGAAKAAGTGFAGSMARAKDAVSDAFRAIGVQLLPSLTSMANYVAANAGPAIATLGSVLHTAGSAIVSVTGFLVQHKTAVMAAVGAMTALMVITKLHAAVLAVQAVGGLAAYITQTRIVTAATKTWAAVQWVLDAALNANPIGLIIVAIAALTAGIIYAYKHSERFRTIVQGALHAVGAAATWLWNSAFAPTIRFILHGFAVLLGTIGNLLTVLSHIPGFGWAKGAADKMHGAAAAAERLSRSIRNIPNKTVSVDVYYRTHGYTYVAGQGPTGRAGGGPVKAKTLYRVGEEGPELFVPKTAGTIIDAKDTAAIMTGRTGRPVMAGGGGTVVNYITVTGPTIGTPDTIAQQIHAALLKRQRETGALGLA